MADGTSEGRHGIWEKRDGRGQLGDEGWEMGDARWGMEDGDLHWEFALRLIGKNENQTHLRVVFGFGVL